MIKASDLIKGFWEALNAKWGYIYGTSHEAWTDAKQAAYVRKYNGDPDRENSCKYGAKWAGHWVTDCSGLFHYWFSRLGGKIAHGSNTIWNDCCTRKGVYTPELVLRPGTAVFTSSGDRHNHIGLYVGEGTVIEAQNTQAGVTTSKLSNKKWTHWGELKGINYQEEKTMIKATVVLPANARGNTVNMREQPNKDSEIVKRVPVGSSVELLEDKGQWCFIEFSGCSGWMMSNYLEYNVENNESSYATVLVPEEQLSTLRDILGRWLEIVDEWLDRKG